VIETVLAIPTGSSQPHYQKLLYITIFSKYIVLVAENIDFLANVGYSYKEG
jgi:hypothetical protein